MVRVNLVLVIPYSSVQGLCLQRGWLRISWVIKKQGWWDLHTHKEGTGTHTRGHAKGVRMRTHTWGDGETHKGGGETYRYTERFIPT